MIRLIKEEFKKLFKNKLNWILVIILIIYPLFFSYKSYQDGLYLNGNYSRYGVENADESKSELELLKEIDEKTHALSGALNQEKIDELYSKGMEELKKIYTLSNLDAEWLTEMYGKNYLDFIERGSQGNLTEEEIQLLKDPTKNDKFEYLEEDGHYYFFVRVKNEGKAKMLSELYFFSMPMGSSFYLGNNDFTCLHEVEMNQPLVQQANHEYFELKIEHSDSSNVHNRWKIAEKLENEIDYTFDSTYPNLFLEANLYKFNPLLLILLAYIVSNIFCVEKQRKTEPILFPTRHGNKVFQAKFLTGLLLALATVTISLLGIFIMSYIILPVRDFDLYNVLGTGYFGWESTLLYTFGQVITIEVLAVIACYLFVAIVTMGISCVSKNALFSFAFMVAFLMIPMYIRQIQENYVLHGIVPIFAIGAPHVLGYPSSYVVLHGNMYPSYYIGWVIYLIIGILLSFVVYKIGQKHQA